MAALEDPAAGPAAVPAAPGPGRRPLRRVVVAVSLALAMGVASSGCGSEQDPGLPEDGANVSRPPSVTLAPCPPGGPDTTTAPAGCLDADGILRHR